MDPISIAASSIALIHACRKLATGIKFLIDLSRAPEEILELADELSDLQNVVAAVSTIIRKRQDDILGVLLCPLFAKVDRILNEICDLCGACPQKVKEDNDYTEQLKIQLLARFKWTRAKKRVGELRERLKVARLDFANSLAAISLLDISHLSSRLADLDTRLLDGSLTRTQINLDNPPQYEAGSMQLTMKPRPTATDIEAQNPQPSSAEKHSTSHNHSFPKHDFNARQCKRACSCVCHSVYRVKTPVVLQSLVGSLFVKSHGLYGMNQACNEYSCQRSSTATVRISYRFPDWLLSRMVSSYITSNRLSGPQVSLAVPRIVSNKSDIFSYAFAGDIDGITKLLRAGLASACDISNVWGYTPLHYAVEKGHIDVCRFLLKAGARPEITDTQDNSVTDIAWNRICVKKVTSKKARELEELFKKDEWFEERQFSILHKIVLDVLITSRSLDQELSTSTSNIETPDSEGRTPLSWAAELGNVSAVKTLLQYNAALESKSYTGMTPLHYATQAPTPDCLVALLENGASAKSHNKWKQSPLNLAAYCQDDGSYITPLLDYGANINERDCYSSTALSNALFMNHSATARCLIERGANIIDQDSIGLTGFNESIENNSHECISLLLESGASLATVGIDGETALHILARRGDHRSIEIFQAAELAGLDPEATTDSGLTAWDIMGQRVGSSDEVQAAFRKVMAKLDSKSSCVTYFDALEKMPMVVGKVPDVVEVTVEEILVN